MNVDPAFRSVQKGRSGFYIWRIEDMKVVAVPREQYGSFYKGDSYIILSIKEIKGTLDANIHFWLGSETTQDEAGVAAYKTVELDDYLGGAPVQHREVEGHESKGFLNYFKSKGGVRYSDGGHKSGFNHVEHTFKQRLLHVKGKHHVRVSETPISWSSMNCGDVFILDTGVVLFVWVGKEASRTERMKALEHARQLRDERGKANIVVVEDGQEKEMTKEELEEFDKHLSLGSKDQLKSKEEGGADEVAERKSSSELKLYVCSEDDGTLKVSEVKEGPLLKSDLDSTESYIIDNGSAGIWAWIGKKSSKKERSEAMRNALGFIKKKNLPTSTNVTRVVEGGEPSDFKCLFRDWPQPPITGKVYSRNRVAKTIQTKFDASTLHSNQQLAAETQMFDDGSGRVEVWRVKDFDLEPISAKYMGQFFAGDCYVIQYTYKVGGKDNHVIYYWQGLKSTTDEKGTSALKAVELDDKLGGAAVQVRVVQGKEPAHFMSMFDGKMIIFSGGHAGWGGQQNNSDGPGDSYMLQVRGTNQLNTKAVQVEMDASSLNTNDVFVIFTKTQVFIWCGKGSTGDEREMAKKVTSRSPREPIMVFEGQEKENFWNVLGGQKPYVNDKRLQEVETNHPARLFQLSNASGRFTVDEVPDFSQQDLVPDDVMILDVWDTVYVWIGSGANKQERDEAESLAIEYVKTDPAGRDPDTPVYKVKQGFEPPTFTGFFGMWDRDLWSKGKTFEELKKELGEGNEAMSLVKKVAENGSMDFQDVAKYKYDELTVPAEELPAGVDPSCREIHLSNEDFEKVFQMKYSDFITKAPWKQQELKKKHRLF
ncbi:advillin-like isoform X2 [Crassostrea virginica]